MDKKNILKDALEDAIPSSKVNLWPAVKASLVAGSKFQQREKVNTTNSRSLSGLAFAVMAIVTLSIVILATPQGRAFAQSVLHLFNRAESDILPVQPFQLTPIPETATSDSGYIFDKTVIEAGKEAGFAVLMPTFLPKILAFEGASYEPDHHIVRIFYSYENTTNGLVIREEQFQTSDDCELCGVVGASADIEIIQIGSITGEYVEGVWKLTDNGPVWESDPYLKTVRWQKDGIAFELVYMGPPEDLTRPDLVAIAESMK